MRRPALTGTSPAITRSSGKSGAPSHAKISELTGFHLRGLSVLVQPDGTLLRGAPAKPGFPSGHELLGRIGDTSMAHCLDRYPMRFSDPPPRPPIDLSWAHPAALLGRESRPLDSGLSPNIRDSPRRFRIRHDERAALLFDTATFRVHVVSADPVTGFALPDLSDVAALNVPYAVG